MAGIGGLRHRIAFERKARVANASGGYTETWPTTVCTVWASVEPQSASETVIGDELIHRVTHLVRIRFRTDITADMRINWGGRLFNILSVANEGERGKYLRIVAQEGAPS